MLSKAALTERIVSLRHNFHSLVIQAACFPNNMFFEDLQKLVGYVRHSLSILQKDFLYSRQMDQKVFPWQRHPHHLLLDGP